MPILWDLDFTFDFRWKQLTKTAELGRGFSFSLTVATGPDRFIVVDQSLSDSILIEHLRQLIIGLTLSEQS